MRLNLATESAEGLTRWQQWVCSWRRALPNWGYRLLQLTLWVSGLFWLLGLLPATRWVQPSLSLIIRSRLMMILIVVLAYVVIQLGSSLIEKVCAVMLENSRQPNQYKPLRLSLRFSTIAGVSKGIWAVVVSAIALGILLKATIHRSAVKFL